MWQTITDREGPDESDLTVRIVPADMAYLKVGAQVCANGSNGWVYIGPVIAMDSEHHTATIQPKARNPIRERLVAMGVITPANRAIG